MARMNWERRKDREKGWRSVKQRIQTDSHLLHIAISYRQAMAKRLRIATDELEACYAKVRAKPDDRVLQAVLKLKQRRRDEAFRDWKNSH